MDTSLPDGPDWARSCSQSLERCAQMGAVAGRDAWAQLRAEVPDTLHPRIVDLDLSARDLSGFDLSRCKLANVSFVGSNLKKTSFRQSILRSCDLTRSDLQAADFDQADLRSSIFRDVQADNQTNFAVMKGRLPEDADVMIHDRAEGAWRRAEFDNNQSRSMVHRGIVRALGYGESVRRLLLAALAAIAGFAVVFRIADAPSTTWPEAAVFSAQYFVALSDPYAERSFALSALGTAEAALGLAFLAMLLSALARHLVISK